MIEENAITINNTDEALKCFENRKKNYDNFMYC